MKVSRRPCQMPASQIVKRWSPCCRAAWVLNFFHFLRLCDVNALAQGAIKVLLLEPNVDTRRMKDVTARQLPHFVLIHQYI